MSTFVIWFGILFIASHALIEKPKRCDGNHDLDVGLVIMVTGGNPLVT